MKYAFDRAAHRLRGHRVREARGLADALAILAKVVP
ncbi:hypothetical protein FDI14_gp045 [Mycobacterium phage SirDuracell]|uniref:Uncharacterized protein n=1 Tax=Mycobacterium phage SirDuracell TaxID=1034116 RepID=G1D5R0_9CAUD|nr:hypothetical protein FDI14_gp045 [Mycobacterium phage SirDuracell]AEK10110.1 hypothetical protein PBI_SIRDURACELL_45 [Mycobacterium phage SirDuracell]